MIPIPSHQGELISLIKYFFTVYYVKGVPQAPKLIPFPVRNVPIKLAEKTFKSNLKNLHFAVASTSFIMYTGECEFHSTERDQQPRCGNRETVACPHLNPFREIDGLSLSLSSGSMGRNRTLSLYLVKENAPASAKYSTYLSFKARKKERRVQPMKSSSSLLTFTLTFTCPSASSRNLLTVTVQTEAVTLIPSSYHVRSVLELRVSQSRMPNPP